jgi:hypothetical protein
LYGFTTWCLALVFLIALSAPVANFVSASKDYIYNRPHVALSSNTAQSAETSNSANTANNSNVAVTNAETTAAGAFALFILFFLGAFASSIGGHFGMTFKERRFE